MNSRAHPEETQLRLGLRGSMADLEGPYGLGRLTCADGGAARASLPSLACAVAAPPDGRRRRVCAGLPSLACAVAAPRRCGKKVSLLRLELRIAAVAFAAFGSCGQAPSRPPSATSRPAPIAVAEAARARDGRRLDGAVVYGIVPPLFGSPPLRAVTKALADLADLGVDVLWLSPVFESPRDDYGYAVTDYAHVRRAYGTAEDLHELVDEAHRQGMRVVLDFVPNHTSSEHPYFVDAEAHGQASPYFGFYARGADLKPTHDFDWINLPKLDYGNERVRRWMVGTTTRWIRDFRLDGFRMDAAWAVRDRAPALWMRWNAAIRREAPGALLVAEASARDPDYFAEGFDLAYDWAERPGAWAWQGLFEQPEHIPEGVWRDLGRAAGPTLRFLNNNDTGARFVTRHGADMTRVASAMLLTLPGVPCVFTGDERGAEYDPYSARVPFGAGSHPELRTWYRTFIALRHSHPALYRGEILPVSATGAPKVFAFVRRDLESGEVMLVALNFDAHPARVTLGLPPPAQGAAFADCLEGHAWRATAGASTLELPGWGVAVARAE
ncbi:MAG: alpha-amylase family glycosyl hydrolase [Polyangiaceae bacterium]